LERETISFHERKVHIYRFEGGKAVEGWTEYNSLELMQQLGVIPPPGG
jgi:hypothetical protein